MAVGVDQDRDGHRLQILWIELETPLLSEGHQGSDPRWIASLVGWLTRGTLAASSSKVVFFDDSEVLVMREDPGAMFAAIGWIWIEDAEYSDEFGAPTRDPPR
jgi:hypothetical protein